MSSTFLLLHQALLAIATQAAMSDFIAPADGSFKHVSTHETTRGALWEYDPNTPSAYPPDGKGSYAVAGRMSDGVKIFLVQAATIRLRALTGYGTGGVLRYTIVHARTGQVMLTVDISQAGPNAGDGASRTDTFPYGDYIVSLERFSGTVAASGVDIRNS